MKRHQPRGAIVIPFPTARIKRWPPTALNFPRGCCSACRWPRTSPGAGCCAPGGNAQAPASAGLFSFRGSRPSMSTANRRGTAHHWLTLAGSRTTCRPPGTSGWSTTSLPPSAAWRRSRQSSASNDPPGPARLAHADGHRSAPRGGAARRNAHHLPAAGARRRLDHRPAGQDRPPHGARLRSPGGRAGAVAAKLHPGHGQNIALLARYQARGAIFLD